MESINSSFNKKLFSELLIKVKGTRTLTRFAEDTSISIAHISRIINQRLDSPPSPETIKKFVGVEKNGVTYKDLMMAAGHLEERITLKNIDIDETPDPMEGITENNQVACNSIDEHHRKYKSLCMSTLLFTLSCNGHTWKITHGSDIVKPEINEFSLEVDEDFMQPWHFQLKYLSPSILENSNYPYIFETNALYTWGQLAIKEADKHSKYSIVTDYEELYNTYLRLAPKNLDLTISLILVNPMELQVLKEDYISFFHGADKVIMKNFILK